MRVRELQLILHKPALYEESAAGSWRAKARAASSACVYPIEGAYLFEPDGSNHLPHRSPPSPRPLVIDPSLSITYSTFLGGTGEDTANSIAAIPPANSTSPHHNIVLHIPRSRPSNSGPGGGRRRFLRSENRPHRLAQTPSSISPSSAAAEMKRRHDRRGQLRPRRNHRYHHIRGFSRHRWQHPHQQRE